MGVVTRPATRMLHSVQSPWLCRRWSLQLASLRKALSGSAVRLTAPRRTQDFNSGFTSSYDPTVESNRGPIFNKSNISVPEFYPKDLKKLIDDYVIGQDRAKKTICSTVFSHLQNLRRRRQLEDYEQKLWEKLKRQRMAWDRMLSERPREPHNPEADFSAAPAEWTQHLHGSPNELPRPDKFLLQEDANLPPKPHKSNLLLIGPTGVGKTYILETLSKKLNVPFTIADCNSFTQAGYVGQDVESCISQLLMQANYDAKAAEHGIVVLDEFDKIAKTQMMHGRDVAGEGVQQALLKLVEGTKVSISVKDPRSNRNTNEAANGYWSSSSQGGPSQVTIDTSNILFVFCGAFVGLDKIVLRRVVQSGMGFGARIKPTLNESGSPTDLPRSMYSHLPFDDPQKRSVFTPLDLTTSNDLEAFGFIPELIGRLHNICALSPLSQSDLYRILTEPKNSLVADYTALFETFPSRLFFTRKALLAVAERAVKSKTGARGLKMEMERVLAEPLFDAPVPYVLITEGCVNGTEKPGYWGKGGRFEVERRMQDEDGTSPLTSEQAFEQHRRAI